jgi:hypothetical protein
MPRVLVKMRRIFLQDLMEPAMTRVKENFVIEEQGNRIGVFWDIEDYRRLLEEIEELEAIKAYDAAKTSGDEAIPFEQAVSEIEQQRG